MFFLFVLPEQMNVEGSVYLPFFGIWGASRPPHCSLTNSFAVRTLLILDILKSGSFSKRTRWTGPQAAHLWSATYRKRVQYQLFMHGWGPQTASACHAMPQGRQRAYSWANTRRPSIVLITLPWAFIPGAFLALKTGAHFSKRGELQGLLRSVGT